MRSHGDSVGDFLNKDLIGLMVVLRIRSGSTRWQVRLFFMTR